MHLNRQQFRSRLGRCAAHAFRGPFRTASHTCRAIAITAAVGFVVALAGCDDGSAFLRPPTPETATPEDDAGVFEPEPEAMSSCRPIRCGDGVVDAPETCDPADLATGATCDDECQRTAPASWTCLSSFLGDGFCDCGCGLQDLDCPAVTSVEQCEFTHCPPRHVPLPSDPSQCSFVDVPGDTCEQAIPLVGESGSLTGILNANDDYEGLDYTECTFYESPGGDIVYSITVPQDEFVEVRLEATQFQPTLIILTACGTDPDLCLIAGENLLQFTVAETLIWNFQQDQEFYIVVDAYDGAGAYTLTWERVNEPFCGDGIRASVEDCDDSNTNNGDGCSDVCFLEPEFACPLAGGSCEPAGCGNGILEFIESCDDGNFTNGDGCSSDCQSEPPASWTCPLTFFGSTDGCDCGCGALDTDCFGETRDSCEFENCNTGVEQVFEQNWICRIPVCGDGLVEGVEECDDGNETANDGCFDCRQETAPEWTCPAVWYGNQNGCHCGCGFLDPDCDTTTSACDVNGCLEGGPNPTDNTLCIVGTCGDGIIEPGEICDDGNAVGGDGCAESCQRIEDGFVCTVSEVSQ